MLFHCIVFALCWDVDVAGQDCCSDCNVLQAMSVHVTWTFGDAVGVDISDVAEDKGLVKSILLRGKISKI